MPDNNKTALIIGGSRGIGRKIAQKLSDQGHPTIVAARNEIDLSDLGKSYPGIHTCMEDASEDGVANALMEKFDPELLILCVGHSPKMAPFQDQSWEEFSGAWNADTKVSHAFFRAALTKPMRAGGRIVVLSSGAGLAGSRLSGGYAGAKRMQMFLSEYAQREAEILKLNLTFMTVVPKQLVQDTELGRSAGEAYSEAVGKPYAAFMGQWDKALTSDIVGASVVDLLTSDKLPDERVFTVTGAGMEPMA
ncbi:SDR family oxidoreductase [Maritalea porphyrae]|uniref:SDR family oxidoreductase n=1 Tax=Maritalea porphyrae TaxID=880732 RepID=UPI0022AFD740|nr:SDR family oxidoreductase [Maritalea porphyrae]MCZ4274130.1 SDR family oxidoreductase [Maritalea porphyrae]